MTAPVQARVLSREKIEQIARVCHGTNIELQKAHGDEFPSLPWDAETEEARQCTIASVERALAGVTPEELHAAWCRDKAAEGWRRGAFKDPVAKAHPALVPYSQLPEHQRVKDSVFIGVVQAMSGGAPSPSRTEWVVFWGGEDPADCAGWDPRDDEADAEEHRECIVGGGVAWRPVTYGPWTVTVPPPPPERGLAGDWSDGELAEFRRWREEKQRAEQDREAEQHARDMAAEDGDYDTCEPAL